MRTRWISRPLVVLCSLILLAACSGTEEAEPITLPQDESAVVAPPAPTQPGDVVAVPTLPPSTQPSFTVGGAVVLSPACEEYVAPIREMFARLDAGEEVTQAEADELEVRVNGALDVCTADEYLEFQNEIFPEGTAPTE